MAFLGCPLLKREERTCCLSQRKIHPKCRQERARVQEAVSSSSGGPAETGTGEDVPAVLVLWLPVAWLIICQENEC